MVVNSLNMTFSALADPTRRAILQRLTRGSASVNEIAEPFAMSQQAISKHLACLERAKLIRKRRGGRVQHCSLEASPIAAVAAWAMNYRQYWEESYDRLDGLLEQLSKQVKELK